MNVQALYEALAKVLEARENAIIKIKVEVKEDEEDGVEISDVKSGIYQGSTHHTKGIVYIDKNLPHEIKRKTLIHELTHCYIREYITHEEKTYSEEMVTDIVANSHDIIHKIVEDYFKGDKGELK